VYGFQKTFHSSEGLRSGCDSAQKNAGRPLRRARHRNQPSLGLFVVRILFLIPSALLVLAIAAGLISALLVLPIALRVTLLMLLVVVLMLVVAPLTRILRLRLGLVGIVRTLFVTHHLNSLAGCLPEDPEVTPVGGQDFMPYTVRLFRQTAGRQIWF
jgi:hypothetical protein